MVWLPEWRLGDDTALCQIGHADDHGAARIERYIFKAPSPEKRLSPSDNGNGGITSAM
jgi:hypothetical protein